MKGHKPNQFKEKRQTKPKRLLRADGRWAIKTGMPTQAPQPERPATPRLCNGCNIFDGLASGSLLLFFCYMSWTHGENAFGQYAFFRGSAIAESTLGIVSVSACAAVGFGLFLLGMRIRHGRYCAVRFPKPKKAKGPGVFSDMRDALEQMLGLKEFEGLDKEAERAKPVKKRILRNWFWQEKTRIGFSSFIFALLMYLTPGFVLHVMGTHVLMYFLMEFVFVMTTLVMWLIAWVELGE